MKNNNVLISVVMPVYNNEAYIERTLDTIFMQSRLPMEVVIVDDGSKDKTMKVIKKYMDGHPEAKTRIKIFEQKNLGAGAARNKGIQNARGNWIMFLDSDDLWEKEKIRIVETTIRENPWANVVTHDEYEIMEDNLEHQKYMPHHKKYQKNKNLFLQLYKGNLFSTSCMTIQKKVLVKVGGFDESLLSAQDYDLWIRVGVYGKIVYLDKALATYVIRKGNITSNTYRRYLCEMKICRKYSSQIIEKVGEKVGKKIIRKRIFQVHKMEAYLALKNKQPRTFLKIGFRLPKEILYR